MSASIRMAIAALPLAAWGCSSGARDAPFVQTPAQDAGADDAQSPVDSGSPTSPEGSTSPPDAAEAGAPEDAGGEASTGSGTDACTGSVAVVGGSVAGASTIAFAATLLHAGTWAVSSLPSNVASPPAVAPLGGGFVAVFVDVSGDLEFATSSWSWSSPASLAGVAAKGAPSLAVVGTTLHLVYQGSDGKYVHGTYATGEGWDSATDPVGGASKQGFGPSAPVASSVAGALEIAYGGQNGSLYDETWSSGAWQPDTQHATAQIGTLSPAIAALSGGSSDTLVVYAEASGTLDWTARSSGTWSTPAVIDASAFTDDAPALVALSGGRAMMAYLGTDQHPYFSVYSPGATPPWTSPAPIGTGSPTLSSPPSLAPGVCGQDAVAVLAESSGVAMTSYTGGTWSAPAVIEGTAGMTFATVASQP
jgi:hypothetical protein